MYIIISFIARNFVEFPQSSLTLSGTIMVERPSGIEEETVFLAEFSKKRNKFHTIERRNRSSHPLHVPSPLEEIIPLPLLLKQTLLILPRLERIASADFKWASDISSRCKRLKRFSAFWETLEIFSFYILSSLSFCQEIFCNNTADLIRNNFSSFSLRHYHTLNN